jgi:hypothetical protein
MSGYQPQDTLNTLVNKSEGPGLQTITPHLKSISGSLSFSAEGSWCLLTTTCLKEKNYEKELLPQESRKGNCHFPW